jgi:transcriptional regulator with XRE-family HTH domain
MLSGAVNISATTPYLGSVPTTKRTPTDQPAGAGFPSRLAEIRKERGMTQQTLAERVGIHVVQLRRYESGGSQPTLDVIRHLAVALSVSADMLLFGKDERGPDADLRFQFEAVSQFDDDDRKAARAVLDGLILRHQAKRIAEAQTK